jgi:hypothetical protein
LSLRVQAPIFRKLRKLLSISTDAKSEGYTENAAARLGHCLSFLSVRHFWHALGYGWPVEFILYQYPSYFQAINLIQSHHRPEKVQHPATNHYPTYVF